VISKLNFNYVFCNARLNAITPANVASGFRKTGVYPFNQYAISCVSASATPNGLEHENVSTSATQGRENMTTTGAPIMW